MIYFLFTLLLLITSCVSTDVSRIEPPPPVVELEQVTSNKTADALQGSHDWKIKLNDFFQKRNNETVPFTVLARDIEGAWQGAVGSSRRNFAPGKPPNYAYNKSWQHVDMSGVSVEGRTVKGTMVLHMTPDLWTPKIGRSFPIPIELDAEVGEDGTLSGSYTATKPDVEEPTLNQMSFAGGTITGTLSDSEEVFTLPEEYTLTFNLQGILHGGDPEYRRRCMVVYVGIRNGNVVKASYGSMSLKRTTISRTETDPGSITFSTLNEQGFQGTIRIPTYNLDLVPSEYIVDVKGTFSGELIT